jgi:hypothetical protein
MLKIGAHSVQQRRISHGRQVQRVVDVHLACKSQIYQAGFLLSFTNRELACKSNMTTNPVSKRFHRAISIVVVVVAVWLYLLQRLLRIHEGSGK